MVWLLALLIPLVLLAFALLMERTEVRLGRDLLGDELRTLLAREPDNRLEQSVAHALAQAVDRYWNESATVR